MVGLASSSRFNVIELSQLGRMAVLEDLDYEDSLAIRLLRFKSIWIEHEPPAGAVYDVENLEFDPIRIQMEANQYFEFLIRDRVNQAARAVTLAFAISTDLDAIASRYPVGPRLAVVNDPRGYPDFPEDYESDDRYRRRTQVSINALSPHGPSGSYMYWAMTADPLLKDVSEVAKEGDRSEVYITCMADDPAEPRPSHDRLLAIKVFLSDAYRKAATDVVVVVPPRVIDISYKIKVWFFPPPNKEALLASIKSSLTTLMENQRWLGHDHTLMAIYAAVNQTGVSKAEIVEPIADISASPRDVVRTFNEDGTPRIELIYMGRSE